MKYLFTLLIMLLVFSVGSAQTVQTESGDLDGAITINFATINNTGNYSSLSFTVLNTQVAGTSDGTITLQGTNDILAWENLADSEAVIFDTGATHTITNGSIWTVQLLQPSFRFYRIVAVGTAGDQTTVKVTHYFRK